MPDVIPSAAPAASPSATPTPSTGAQPSAPTTSPNESGNGNQGGQVDGFKQLREAYDGLKAKYEPWDKLGVKPEQVTQFSGVYQKLHGEIASIGRELGYPDAEIAEAMAEDPVRTLDFLRNQAEQAAQNRQQPGGEQELQELVAQHVEQAIGPIQQRENIRITNEANALFERVAYQELGEALKAEGIDPAQIPQDERFMVISAASEILKYDGDALHALKFEGKTAPVQKAVREALTYLDKYYLARAARDKTRVQPAQPGRPAAPQGQRRPSLDEIIDNPGVLGKQYA